MKYSHFLGKTRREAPSGELSLNAKLLEQAGYINKLSAGVYSYLPLGKRVIDKISEIIREEMNNVGGQEIFLPAIHPADNWKVTGRWDSFDVLFRIKDATGRDMVLGPTHEEVLYPLMKSYVKSYKDLPLAVYQIQTKFRDELRSKSGLLRGREFLMKDLYSFHTNQKDLEEYYDLVTQAYKKIFERVGVKAILTDALGGTFSHRSHEFQVETSSGEDTVYYCKNCDHGWNKEVADEDKMDTEKCSNCGGSLAEIKCSEVGNIFKLTPKYSEDFDFSFTDETGKEQLVIAGCYGLGVSRLMGVIAEVFNDEAGLIWPENIAPYKYHLINLSKDVARAEDLYKKLSKTDCVLYDDRQESPGIKFKDSDLIGLPYRIIISDKLKPGEAEVKDRKSGETKIIKESDISA